MKNDTTAYWHKLDDYNSVISTSIQKRLPADYHLTLDDIKSEVNGTYIQLIKLYRERPNGMSLTSYCWQYAEHVTYNRIISDYKRMINQVAVVSEELIEEDETGVVHHQYGTYQIEPYTALEDHLDVKTKVDDILSKASQADR